MKTLDTTDTPLTHCPNCQTPMNAATGDGHPKEGDFSLCIECAALLTYRADLTVRPTTRAELLRLDPRDRMQLAITRLRILYRLAGLARDAQATRQ